MGNMRSRWAWRAVWRPTLLSASLVVLMLTSMPGRTAYVQGSCDPSPHFAPALTVAAGSRPETIASGDLNGDGRPDLAVANSGESSVSLLLNTTAAGAATTSFADQLRVTDGLSPFGAAIGDLDGDGKPDLVVTNIGANSVSVLRNTTAPQQFSPSFTSQITLTTPLAPSAVAMSDIDGDGKLDVVIANAGGHNVSVFLNRTAAAGLAFVQKTLEAGDGPSSIAIADFNADGKPDLALNNTYGASVSVLINTTPPNAALPFFADRALVPAGLSPLSVAAGDLNSDGRPDLVSANNFFSTISVARNTTSAGSTMPSFDAAPERAVGGGPYDAVLADIDADGRPDLVVSHEFSDTISIFANQTAAGASAMTLRSSGALAVGARPHGIVAADLNGDGMRDLAVANTDGASVSILLNRSRPATMSATGGAAQDAWLQTQFALPLEVHVFDGCGAALSGVRVAYQAPIRDASATLSAATVITDSAGVARVRATANGVPGSYVVLATVSGAAASAAFPLTNRQPTVLIPLLLA